METKNSYTENLPEPDNRFTWLQLNINAAIKARKPMLDITISREDKICRNGLRPVFYVDTSHLDWISPDEKNSDILIIDYTGAEPTMAFAPRYPDKIAEDQQPYREVSEENARELSIDIRNNLVVTR